MIKKFFKALLVGFWMSDVCRIITIFINIGWCPIIVALVLKMLNITLSLEVAFFVLFASIFFGIHFSSYVSHCIEAVKYSEEKKCDLTEAWHATEHIRDKF